MKSSDNLGSMRRPSLPPRTSRREFIGQLGMAGAGVFGLGASGALSTLPLLADEAPRSPALPRLKVATIFTAMHLHSHASNILESFLEPYIFDGRKMESGMDVISFYADQFPRNDWARDISKRYEVPLYGTVAEAMCGGGETLAADAVLLIGEHGNYRRNELGQTLWPRKELFDQIVKVIEPSRREIPLFCDKYLTYRWDWAKEMYDTAKRLKMPFMAGSSVPLGQRIPDFELPRDARIAAAVSVHGGGAESYDFHALEVLQAIVEARKGGETGVSKVNFAQGPEALKQAADEGYWSPELLKAAMAAEIAVRPQLESLRDVQPSWGIMLEYKDGLKAAALRVPARNGSGTRWNFACRLAGENDIRAFHHYAGPWDNHNLFMALSHAIQHLFRTKREPYAVERTLLTTGVLEAAMRSRQQKEALATPNLEFAYTPIDFRGMRETGESWKLLKVPDPLEFPRGGVAGLVEWK